MQPVRRPFRVSAVLTLASLFLVAFAQLVLAQESQTTVTTQTRERSRQLDVRDIAGGPLTDLTLRDGEAYPFQTIVTDQDIELAGDDFTVQATMNNLYRVTEGGHDFATMIPSEKVEVGFAADPLSATDVLADLEVAYLLQDVDGITCSKVNSLLGGGTLSLTELLNLGDPICELLEGLGLLSLLADDPLIFSGVPLAGDLVTGVGLDGLGLDELPLAIGRGDTGPFSVADCVHGIGAGDSCTSTGTPRVYMTGTTLGSLGTNLLATLEAALPTPLVGTADDGISTVSGVIAALRASTDPAVASLGDALGSSSYDDADRIALINGLITTVDRDLALSDIGFLAGRYRSVPTLRVDTTDAPAGGEYQGTMTVRLLDGQLPQ